MAYQWADCDRSAVSQRYDRIAKLIPFFEWALFLPWGFRRNAVKRLELSRGGSVLEIGCGTGRNFPYLREAVGPAGRIYGVDISTGMLNKAAELCDANHWRNIELNECDAASYVAPEPLDGVLFGLSYNTMPHHFAVLRKAWDQLRPGGSLVIMDAKVPDGFGAKLVLPFSLWLMKHTLLGNPLIHPWVELSSIADNVEMSEMMFGSYYVCRAVKPMADATARGRNAASTYNDSDDIGHQIAAE